MYCTYHSWANPAEQIISIINLGLQGVAIMRDMMSTELEEIFKKADTLEEIRAIANKNINLKNELYDLIFSGYCIPELKDWYYMKIFLLL